MGWIRGHAEFAQVNRHGAKTVSANGGLGVEAKSKKPVETQVLLLRMLCITPHGMC